ncbi:MAG TPA: CocE/NonD family hydrolase, partial [Bacillales bacterium]|nr:CocE/NonD family hydrolase [Bacillales bacterium]
SVNLPMNAEAAEDHYSYDPNHPVPFITDMTSSQIGGPDDYSAIERRDDILVYSTEPLGEDTEVTGPVKMELYASSTAKDTDFMVKLVDVWPSGYAQRLCDGMVRARFRKGMDRPELIQPGETYCFEIDCWNTSHVFLKGHQIRVEVTSSAFPKYDRNLNTGEELGQTTETFTAEQTVYHSEAQPSAIVLPVIPNQPGG